MVQRQNTAQDWTDQTVRTYELGLVFDEQEAEARRRCGQLILDGSAAALLDFHQKFVANAESTWRGSSKTELFSSDLVELSIASSSWLDNLNNPAAAANAVGYRFEKGCDITWFRQHHGRQMVIVDRVDPRRSLTLVRKGGYTAWYRKQSTGMTTPKNGVVGRVLRRGRSSGSVD